MQTLYRKYRPQTYKDVAGQEHIIKTITNEISANKVAHAFLFSGPRGVGKTTTARLLAKAVNCHNRKEGSFEPCDKCPSCEEIAAGRSIDVMEIDAASQTGVDNVRENIIENAQFKPTNSKFKVFIIDEVHMLSTSAFNALLKTLEEPPSHVIFILATTELHKLPETIISRCQRFNFKKIGFDIMMKRLKEILKEEEIKMDEEVLARIIQKSDGCMRDAESLLGQVLSLNLKHITIEDARIILPVTDLKNVLDFVEHLIKKEAKDAIEIINKLIESGSSINQFALDIIEILRVIMIAQTGLKTTGTEFSAENLKKIEELGKLAKPYDITRLIESAMKKKQEIKNCPVPQLPLEIMAVECSCVYIPPEVAAKTNAPKTEFTPKKLEKTVIYPSLDPTKTIKSDRNDVNIAIEQIKTRWQEFIDKIAETNHSLTFVLKMCRIEKIENGFLHIFVPYMLHKEKLDEPKNRKAVEDYLAEMFGQNIGIQVMVLAGANPNPVPSNNVKDADLDNIAAQFGGEVVG